MRKLSAISALLTIWALACAGQALAAPGELDKSFGNLGVVPLGTPSGSLPAWYAEESVGGADGATYVLESAQECEPRVANEPPLCKYQEFVVRYRADGSRDTSYGGTRGFALVYEGTEPYGSSTLAVDPEGRLLVARAANWTLATGMVLSRFDSSGSLDPSFGSGGRVPLGCTCAYESSSLFFDAQGRIVLAGVRNEMTPSATGFAFGANSVYVTRLATNGSADSSFGVGGVTSIEGFSMWDVAMRQNGSLVMIAFKRGEGASLVRLSANGKAVDRTFNASKQLRNRKPYWLVALPKNRLAVVGDAARASKVFIMRINGGGAIDSRYGHRGIAEPSFLYVSSVAADQHGRLFLAGSRGPSGSTGNDTAVLLRRLANGKADRTFHNGLLDRNTPRSTLHGFYAGSRPTVFQTSSYEPECRFYCRPEPNLYRFQG